MAWERDGMCDLIESGKRGVFECEVPVVDACHVVHV